jgi:3-oxoacyl-[acyl-carrier-protein] synthase III
MLFSEFKNLEIEGMAVALPVTQQPLTSFNDVFGEKSVSQISEMTGVKSFYRALPEQTASDLGFEAAKKIIDAQRINRAEIAFLIFVTQKPDVRVPSTAFLLHQRLELSQDCLVFDINLACSGFIYGLHTLCSLLSASGAEKGLIITGDTSHRTLSPLDRTMIMLFGDSGTATLVAKRQNARKISFALRTDGNRFKSIVTPAGAYRNLDLPKERTVWGDGIERSDYDTHMKGMEVFTFSITDVAKLMDEFLKYLEATPEHYDTFALHQANIYILKQLSRKVKIPFEKIQVALDRYGNNSSNSVPLALADRYGVQKAGDARVMMCGFGAGLSWACCDVTINTEKIYPVIFTDDYYNEPMFNGQ